MQNNPKYNSMLRSLRSLRRPPSTPEKWTFQLWLDTRIDITAPLGDDGSDTTAHSCSVVASAAMLFENDRDGQRVLAVLGKRLGRYGLRLHPDKTRYLDFRPNRPRGHGMSAAFDFLGFTHYWVRSRKGYPVVRQTTAKGRFARAMRAVNDWCRRHRHDAVPMQWTHLASVLRGHGNYYGLRGNLPFTHKSCSYAASDRVCCLGSGGGSVRRLARSWPAGCSLPTGPGGPGAHSACA